jgi:hypothetical protein
MSMRFCSLPHQNSKLWIHKIGKYLGSLTNTHWGTHKFLLLFGWWSQRAQLLPSNLTSHFVIIFLLDNKWIGGRFLFAQFPWESPRNGRTIWNRANNEFGELKLWMNPNKWDNGCTNGCLIGRKLNNEWNCTSWRKQNPITISTSQDLSIIWICLIFIHCPIFWINSIIIHSQTIQQFKGILDKLTCEGVDNLKKMNKQFLKKFITIQFERKNPSIKRINPLTQRTQIFLLQM